MNIEKPRRVMIQTLGCQMNVYDSEKMMETLAAMGYEPVDTPWKADLVIVNTCAIREKAEQKVMSSVGRLCGIKRRRPHMKIAVAGCVAQYQSEKIFNRFEGVDLIFGTRVIHRLAEYVQAIEKDRTRIVDVEMPETNENSLIQNQAGPAQNISGPTTEDSCHLPAESKISRFVTIMQGCDNFCSYCVVPYVRGRETSIPPEKIIHEAEACVRAGAKEIVLLGQNVNSYGKKEGLCSFAQLLDSISDISGLERIRFVTSHPKDLSDELIDAFARIDKLCNHIHLPVQSGSNEVLKRMNRKYSRESYLDRIRALRSVRPDIAITSDFIVGFPGENRQDFEMTLDLLETVRFDTLFAFEYSDRDLAPSRKFDGKVEEEEKHDRLRRLLECQTKITRQIYEELVGSGMKILVEGPSKHGQQMDSALPYTNIEMTGRSSENRIINFTIKDQAQSFEPESLVGKVSEVVIEKACANSLKAKMPSSGASFVQAAGKGGKIHAA